MEIVYLIIGLVSGGGIGYLAFRGKLAKQKNEVQERISQLDKEKGILQEKLNDLNTSYNQNRTELEQERLKNTDLNTRMARAEVEYKNLREKLDSQKSELEDLQKKFTTEFENIAHKILKQNTREFTETSQKNMGDLLNPLKDKILTFEKKVEDTYQKGLKDQTDLRAEMKKLFDLNARISEEANNLTRALKSDSKKQGNWGEIILERVLERSGLIKGEEYETQVSAKGDTGELLRPDVIVKLPEDKHIIIDSKVSLVAYEAYASADDDDKRDVFLKQHVESIKNHVKQLSEKNYQHAELFDTPDFVLLFMPIEPAFSSAIQADINLFNIAWEKKIVIVSPSTLLATLRTVASIWKHEKQTQNAIEIARQGGALYDKFVGFLKNLEEIGTHINRLGKSYEEARGKLTDGRGNLIRQVESLKVLGAKTSKSIPENYLDNN
ncbi:MAG: DNA recombination protein RmuC [Bacteroidetes bacterium]|nr:DNA recombination protein RmuC [Bacteroidota bacterium]